MILSPPETDLGHTISRESIQSKITSIQDEIATIIDDKKPPQEVVQVNQQRIGELIGFLCKNMEALGHVFTTESGSYYFTLDSGASLRIQMQEDGQFCIHPFMEHVFFVDSQ